MCYSSEGPDNTEPQDGASLREKEAESKARRLDFRLHLDSQARGEGWVLCQSCLSAVPPTRRQKVMPGVEQQA